jgi:hypothetical protein
MFSSVWPLRAAYARTPRLPTSANGVILGITAVTVMSSPVRRDSSWAYPAMNRWVALAPAYPPLAGDPLMALRCSRPPLCCQAAAASAVPLAAS